MILKTFYSKYLLWYEQGYFYGVKNFNPDKRSNYLVLNDIAHGLFLEQYFRRLYQELIWDKINGEYHPYFLNKITSDLVRATAPIALIAMCDEISPDGG